MLATSVILFLLGWLKPLTGEHPPLLLFLIAVMLAAWYGATRAGLFATALSALNSAFFLHMPIDPLIAPPGAWLQMVLLVGTGSLTTLLINQLRQAETEALETSVEKQRQLERALEKRKTTTTWFEWAVEAAPNGMLLVSEDGTILMANAQAERLFGYARDELVGESIESLVPERFRSQHAKDRRHFLARPETRPMGRGRDLCGRRKDGQEIPVEIGLSPITGARGILVLASIIDISRRQRAEQALHESDAHFRAMAETVPDILFTRQLDGRSDYVSPRFYEYTGLPPGAAKGFGWLEALPPEDRESIPPAVTAVCRDGGAL